MIAIIAAVMIGCVIECLVSVGILDLKMKEGYSDDEALRVLSVTTSGPPVRVGIPKELLPLPEGALDVMKPIEGRRGARAVRWTNDVSESDIWLGDALDALEQNDKDQRPWRVIGALLEPPAAVRWFLVLGLEDNIAKKSKEVRPGSLRDLIRDAKRWPRIELVLPRGMATKKARTLATRAWAAATVAHGDSDVALSAAERSGRVLVSPWRSSSSAPAPAANAIVVRLSWSAYSYSSANKQSVLPYVSSKAFDTSDALIAIAPEMTLERVRAFVSKERPSEEIEVLSSRALSLLKSEASDAAVAVSAQMSELLVRDVTAAAEVSALEALGAQATEASAAIARDLTAHRMTSLQKRSPYGLPAVPVLEQYVELVPSAEDSPTVLEVRYPSALRDATKGLANPMNGGGVQEVVIAERVFQGVRLKRGDRLVLGDGDTYFVVAANDKDGVVLQRPAVLRIARQLERAADPARNAWTVAGTPEELAIAKELRPGDEVLWSVPSSSKGQAPFLATVVSSTGSRVYAEVPADRMEASIAAASGAKQASKLVEMRDWLHPLSRCSGDPKVPTRTLCEKGRTRDVQPDEEGGSNTASVWDRPCEHDLDCPYYDPSSGRGGCLGGGMCEVPLGVRRVGYRHVDPKRSGPPLCWTTGTKTNGGGECAAPVFPLKLQQMQLGMGHAHADHKIIWTDR